MKSVDPRVSIAVKEVVEYLVAGKYAELEEKTCSRRLTAGEIGEAITEYGVVLMMPPQEIFEGLDIVQVTAAERPEWSAHCPLWSIETGRTDLTLELTLFDDGEMPLKVEIDGIHVL